MNGGVTDRDFGRLEAEVIALKVQNTELKADIKELRADIQGLVDAVSEAKGGWKVLFAIGTASAGAGALLVKIVTFFKVS